MKLMPSDDIDDIINPHYLIIYTPHIISNAQVFLIYFSDCKNIFACM